MELAGDQVLVGVQAGSPSAPHRAQEAVALARVQEVKVQARSPSAPRGTQVCHLLLHLVRTVLPPGLAT